jgi:3-oxoacyl-[acyl-carrier-protein] synthase III
MADALAKGDPISTQTMARPGMEKLFDIHNVPPPEKQPTFFMHPRLRRASVITLHTVAASLEALGNDVVSVQSGALRLGIIVCTTAGSVIYSRRFYEEVLREPAMASPLLFPETVFNAPASHLAAYLGANGYGYTLVGDNGTFLQGLAMATDWLFQDQADGVVVIGAEESDWVISEAMRLFQRNIIHGSGAGAVYLKKEGQLSEVGVELQCITDSFSFTQMQTRAEAARKMKAQLPAVATDELYCDNENENYTEHFRVGQRLSPNKILGEAFAASAAWQCIAACDLIRQKKIVAANVAVVGANQQAIGARFAGSYL